MKTENTMMIQYEKYMEVVNRSIKNIKESVKALPELDRVSKMSFEEWCEFQNIKN